MRILICGDRNWRDPGPIWDLMVRLLGEENLDEPVVIIHGDARGADTCADICARLWFFDVEPFPAVWDTHGRRAGPIRNQQMLDSGIDRVYGFHEDISKSKGTKDMLDRAYKDGIPTFIHDGKECYAYRPDAFGNPDSRRNSMGRSE